MPHSLSFNILHNYDASLDSITVPVILSNSYASVKILAKLDTGASNCIFQREHGEELGIDIEKGQPRHFGTGAGSFLAYGHDISLSALGYQFDVTVFFSFHLGFPRNVLGRRGWIEQVRLGIIDYEGKLYASKYDDPT